jgi:hypothetical protein
MYSGELRTALIIRRMVREPLSVWTGYTPLNARPEEVKFDLFDGGDKRIGEFAYLAFELKLLKPMRVALMTPWGEAMVARKDSGPAIMLNGSELAIIGGSLFKRGFDLTFPDGRIMRFIHLKGGRNDIQYSEGSGRIVGVEEKGTLPEGMSSRSIQPTKEEIKMLPKADRPRSIETRNYRQFRISTSGTFPVDEERIVKSLAIFASFGMLMDELPSSG